MRLGLGNTLVNGGGSLNPDGLSLDLQFATDKTLTARKGPTPTFTRASTATFVGSDGLIQSAAINQARFDHDPSTLVSRGLLIEESRTNLCLHSNTFNNWTVTNSTVEVSSVLTPEGTADAWKSVEDILLATHSVARNFTPVSGTTYTMSVWLKSAENGFAFVGLAGGGFTATFISVNLSTGAVTTATGSPVGAASVGYSNGWWRVSFSLAATASASSTINVRLSRDGDWANRTYLGNGVNGIYVYGAQVEAGAFPTSYIPTTSASVVRSMDLCSITGSDFTGMYNEFAGTVLCESTLNGVGPIVNPDTAVFGGQQNGIFMREYTGASSLNGIITSDESLTFDSSMGNVSSGVARKSSMAFQNGGSAILCLNGTLGTQDNSVTLPSDATGGSTPIELTLFRGQFSTVKSFRYYKKRLANAKLQALTA